ncbi:Aldo/keto reductase [Atractiella rhizophila]|nr:Aldo/keto reductase [Atractiella rhizophila]
MSTYKYPEIVIGGAQFSPQVPRFSTAAEVSSYLSLFSSNSIIDTSARYYPVTPGSSETLIGEAEAAAKGYRIDTKANSPLPDGHDPSVLRKNLEISLQRLKTHKVRCFYLHAPNKNTSLDVTMKTVDELFREGKFSMFGVSNFSLEEMGELLAVCEKNGYVKPSIYQGAYNGIMRQMEVRLLPLLRKHDIRFYAYAPQAAGYFTGKYTKGFGTEEASSGRMGGTSPFSSFLQKTYSSSMVNAAVDTLLSTLPAGLTGPEVALRWLAYHSALDAEKGDGIIIGASSEEQAKKNLDWFAKGPLEQDVMDAMEKVWEQVKADPPKYFDV